ncbi:hypothetical protein D6821_00655 [Candidatus Parcubacteria bacterium]|nr:MAG: hypothetical protein D6821_00655 [Candidatus Parcubacteria bacterium]
MRHSAGFVVLSTIIVVGLIVLGLAVSVPLLGWDATETSPLWQQKEAALYLAESCGEEILRRLKADQNFSTSSLTISWPQGSCEGSIASQSDTSRLLSLVGQSGASTQNLEITIGLNNSLLSLINWKEK